ncbi:MAG: hypothetical protein LBM05_02250, partial [Endomicrobium sp.]|nr:hypothetical protein [Endomicrobium sp.]
IEFLSANKTIKVLFATHYLELNKLSKNILGVKNYSFSVQKDSDNNIKFLYKLQEGIAKHSYGIYVAKLAGIPIQVIERAYKILNHLKDK